MNFNKTHLTLAELGRLFNKSAKEVGCRLKELGLRTSAGKPSDAAFTQKLIGYENPGTWGWTHVWNAERTVERLVDERWTLVVPPPQDLVIPPVPIGPFTVRHRNNGSEVVGADGEACVWLLDRTSAHNVCNCMNAGHRLGVFSQRTHSSIAHDVKPDAEAVVLTTEFTVVERHHR